MNFGSLFSGIGGIDLGLERAGMTCKWQVEIDDFCQKVLDKHWPEVRKYRDVREVGKHNLEPVDLIAGGFPCQPHSVAGKRRGKDDDRNLWPEYLRIIREVRPTWVVGENVPGIITTMLDDVLSDLEGAGYTPTVFNIPAAAFGANHIRYRIIVVAHNSNAMCQRYSESATAKNYSEGQSVSKKEQGNGNGIWTEVDGCSGVVTKEYLPNADNNGCDSWRSLGGNRHDSNDGQRNTEAGGEIGREWECESGEVGKDENPNGERLEGTTWQGIQERDWQRIVTRTSDVRLWENWSVEPNVGRVANGVPNRVDRLKSLGNAVVPQVAEYIGRCIMEAERDYPSHD